MRAVTVTVVLGAVRFGRKVGACYHGSVKVDHVGEKARRRSRPLVRALIQLSSSRSVLASRFGATALCRRRVLTCPSVEGHVTAVVARNMRRDQSV